VKRRVGPFELLLAQPVKRYRLVIEKAAGIALALTAASVLSWLGFVVAKQFSSTLAVTNLRCAEAVLAELPLTFLYLALALAASSVLPNRAAASMACIGLVIADFFINTISAAVKSISNLHVISPIYWSDSSHVLLHGFDPLRAGGMVVLAAAVLAAAVFAFERRDLSSGGREIAKPRFLRRHRSANHEALPPDSPVETV